MKTIKIIPVIITVLIFVFLISGCQLEDVIETESELNESTTSTVSQTDDTKETVSEDNRIDISSQEYYDLVINTFVSATKDSDYFTYSFDNIRGQYLEICIEPNGKYDENTFLTQAKKITKTVLDELKKHEYKSGGIFKNNLEVINLFFYDYDKYGDVVRSESAFIRIDILDIQNMTEEKLSF